MFDFEKSQQYFMFYEEFKSPSSSEQLMFWNLFWVKLRSCPIDRFCLYTLYRMIGWIRSHWLSTWEEILHLAKTYSCSKHCWTDIPELVMHIEQTPACEESCLWKKQRGQLWWHTWHDGITSPVSAGDPKFKPRSIRFQICTKTTNVSIFIWSFGSVDMFERDKNAQGQQMHWVLIPVPVWVNLASHLQQDVKVLRNVSSLWGRLYSCD